MGGDKPWNTDGGALRCVGGFETFLQLFQAIMPLSTLKMWWFYIASHWNNSLFPVVSHLTSWHVSVSWDFSKQQASTPPAAAPPSFLKLNIASNSSGIITLVLNRCICLFHLLTAANVFIAGSCRNTRLGCKSLTLVSSNVGVLG